METFERLRGLVKEVVELCENTEKEAKQITDKADEYQDANGATYEAKGKRWVG